MAPHLRLACFQAEAFRILFERAWPRHEAFDDVIEFTQMSESVCRGVKDRAGPQDARNFGNRALAILYVVEHVLGYDRIEGVFPERTSLGVAMCVRNLRCSAGAATDIAILDYLQSDARSFPIARSGANRRAKAACQRVRPFSFDIW